MRKNEAYDKQKPNQTFCTLETNNTTNPSTPKNLFQFIPQVRFYKKIQRPIIDDQQLHRVQNRMTLDQKSFHGFQDREAMQDFYLNNTHNQFLVTRRQQQAFFNANNKKYMNQTINIVEYLQPKYKPNERQNRGVNRLNKQANVQQYHKAKDSYEYRSQNLVRFVSKSKQSQQKVIGDILNKTISFNKNKNEKLDLKTKQKINDAINKLNIKQLTLNNVEKKKDILQKPKYDPNSDDINFEELQIQNIANIKQQNYFLHNKNKLNIFKICWDDDYCVGAYDQLMKKNFNLKIIYQKTQKIGIPIYRDLAKLGRSALTQTNYKQKQMIQLILINELTINPKQINFQDLMSMASNRLSANYFYSRMHQFYDDKKSNSSQQLQFEQIIYKQNQRNNQGHYLDPDQQLQQAETYKRLQLNLLQRDYQQSLLSQKRNILQLQQQRKAIKLQTIHDIDVDKKINEKIKMMISIIANEDPRRPPLSSRNIKGIKKQKQNIGKDQHFHLNKIELQRQNYRGFKAKAHNEDLQRTVRLNKVSNNRNVMTKTKILNQIFIKRSHFSQLMSKSKSKSKNKTKDNTTSINKSSNVNKR